MHSYYYLRIRGDVTAETGLTAQQMTGHPMVSEAEGIFVYDTSESFADSEKAISFLRDLCNGTRAKVMAKVRADRQEDVKKILYAGCTHAVVECADASAAAFIHDASARFGKDKIIALLKGEAAVSLLETEAAGEIAAVITSDPAFSADLPVLLLNEEEGILQIPETFCAGTEKRILPWEQLKKLSDGLVPCIVQDAGDGEVLMMAYMNKEAYENTIRTGRMTYYSRSRQELWIKGETSGHYQYLKSLSIDCDNDTLLAKVEQIGAACHTGNRSCFFTELVADETSRHAPAKVFREVYDIIADRKAHPKEGSYTNYLFEKGIDKILKKVGEEATEIVIAAKNPDKEEIKYEIADFLYHAMVLMVEKGVTWEEITTELARR